MSNNNPLIVKCSSCGSKVEYDIKEHSYCCKACGQETSNADAVTNLANWRQQQQKEIKEQLHGLPHTVVHCQNCGAEFFFKENEATATCPYCDTPMVRRDYQETDSFPESIIPFNITLEEAKKKLQDYLNQSGHKFKEEAEIAQKNINKMQGFYLPYCLIRGPLGLNIGRALTRRNFHCEVYVEKNFISGSKELDNLVLDAMEPFDWKDIVPFNFGYISGQSVKIRNIGEDELKKRAVEEVAVQVRDQIVKELDTEAIDIYPDSASILSIPVLLPVYYYKSGDFTVVVNGQTGRVSITNNHETRRIVNYSGWIALAAFSALGVFLLKYLGFMDDPNIDTTSKILLFLVYFFSTPVGLIVLLMPKRIRTIVEKFPHASEKCLAIRKPDQTVQYKYDDVRISNEEANPSFWKEEVLKPIFWETFDSKKRELEFYKVYKGRTLLKHALTIMFIPFVICLLALICISFYYNSFELFKSELVHVAFINAFWILGYASTYILVTLIYHYIKYDLKIEQSMLYGNLYITSFYPLVYGIGIVICIIASMILLLITFGCGNQFIEKQAEEAAKQIKIVQEAETKQKAEAARKAEIEEIQKSVPKLKQDETSYIDVVTKNKVLFLFSEKYRSYFINFVENGQRGNTLFSTTQRKDERVYMFNNGKDNNSEPIYKVNTYSDSFVVTDLKTEERWKVIYDKARTFIKKEQTSEKKILYMIKYFPKQGMYYLVDNKGDFVGYTILDSKTNNLLVAKKNDDGSENKSKLNYYSLDSKPRVDGNKLLGSPAILTIDEFPINLRWIMTLELSQFE